MNSCPNATALYSIAKRKRAYPGVRNRPVSERDLIDHQWGSMLFATGM